MKKKENKLAIFGGKKINDVAGVHIDLNSGGERLKKEDLVTLWIPIIGFSKKYTLNLVTMRVENQVWISLKAAWTVWPIVT